MAIPEWITINPKSGGAGTTKVSVRTSENTGPAREAVLQITDGTNTFDYTIKQAAANRYVINIKPGTIGENIPTEEDLSDFAYDIYHINNETGEWETSDYSNLISDLEYWSVSNIYINWSPFNGQNLCDYVCYMETKESSISPDDCFNPNASQVMARFVLNGSLRIQQNKYAFNLKNAAFHQGSPILEVTVERNSTKLRIYTLSSYQNDVTGDRVKMSVQEATPSGSSISMISAVIYSNASGMIWRNSDIQMAGALNASSMQPRKDEGIMRVELTHASSVGGLYRWRILKWYVDASNVMHTYAVRAVQEKYNPLDPIRNIQDIVRSDWSGTTGEPVSESKITMTDNFYNPE